MVGKASIVDRDYAQGRFQSAIDAFAKMKTVPSSDAVRLQTIVAQCHYRLGRPDAAADHFSAAAALAPAVRAQRLPLHELAFELYRKAGRTLKAFHAAEQVLAFDPRHLKARQFHRHHLFDFLMLDRLKISNEATLAGIEAGDDFFLACELPFNVIHWSSDERVHARIFGEGKQHVSAAIRAERHRRPHAYGDRIRVGYLSNDLSSVHATTSLLRGVLDRHDRNRFDVTLYCYTDDALRALDDGFRQTCGRLVDIARLDDRQAAEHIRANGIDILVDLKGHTKSARVDLVNLGLAPVQVAWLGFPGSGTGVDCDYIIGDPIVTPETSKPYYHEKFCRLPETYQPNDDTHRPLPPPARREDLLLPGDRPVFASFNAIKKISPETFSAWVRILKAVPDGVLWILCPEAVARENLLRLVEREGIGRDRIVFAEHAGYAAHLARLQAADIALDPFPVCGHTTTSDCLWAGLPVVSLRGRSFASRVSESLLTALGLPDLVADDIDAYVALASDLATDRPRLDATRQTIARNRCRAPLFDTERFTRHLELAYGAMIDRAKAGLDPDHIDIPPLPPRPFQ